MEDFNQPRSAKIKLAIVLAIVFVIGMLMIATSKKARSAEPVHINMRGMYKLDRIVVTDSLGNEFEPSWKEFDFIVPVDTSYVIQIDVYTTGRFQSFEPHYSLGGYVLKPEHIHMVEPNHYRVVCYAGLLSSRVEYNFLEKRIRAGLYSSIGMNGEIVQEVTNDEALARE